MDPTSLENSRTLGLLLNDDDAIFQQINVEYIETGQNCSTKIIEFNEDSKTGNLQTKRKTEQIQDDTSKAIKLKHPNLHEYKKNISINSSNYKNEVQQAFDKLEESICGETINEVNEQDDIFPNNVFIEDDDVNYFQNTINSALKNNATKDVVPQKLINKTLVSEDKSNAFESIGPFYGLPTKIMDLIKSFKGIEKLYDWQDECLKLPAIESRRNLIYSLPTSGGKTLVAEILMFRELLCRRRNVIFVLPYVAIVQEKVWALSPFAVALDFLIEEFAAGKGTYPPRKRRYKNSLYIATTEKASGLINSLVEEGRLSELGLIVVDELHLIGDDQRGAILEALLAKLMFLNEKVQIVGMSATIGNLRDIQEFLNAEVYVRNFRPIELIEHVKCENKLFKVNYDAEPDKCFEFIRTHDFNYSKQYAEKDPDRLGGMVMEIIPNGSVLIFCSSKASCENVAILLSEMLRRTKLTEHRREDKFQLLKALHNETNTICPKLKLTIPYGIAYHHSGLTSEERRLIEDSYRTGILCVICCTSTLAAGVNLPARRVIIRSPYIAKDFLKLSRYKQMIGRAGRAGLGDLGESILICKPEDVSKVKNLLLSPMDQILSKINDNNGSSLRFLFLSCLSLKIINTRTDLEKVANTTLLAVQVDKLEVNIKDVTKRVLVDIFKLGAVEIQTNGVSNDISVHDVTFDINSSDISKILESNKKFFQQRSTENAEKLVSLHKDTKLVISKLGKASIKANLDLHMVHILYADLVQAQESLVLLDSLHLLYLVTPYDLSEQIKPLNSHYHNILMQLGVKEKKTATILGITDYLIVRMFSNSSIKKVPERVLNRFYMSLMLQDLWDEISVIEVAEKYRVTRGVVQNLMTRASSFASNVVHFCQELPEFWPFAHLLEGMSQRLAHCCCKELLPLMELPAVKQNRARQLYDAGFKTLQSIAAAKPEELLTIVEFLSKRVANQLIAAAKLMLLEKVETLRETAEDVLEGINHI